MCWAKQRLPETGQLDTRERSSEGGARSPSSLAVLLAIFTCFSQKQGLDNSVIPLTVDVKID